MVPEMHVYQWQTVQIHRRAGVPDMYEVGQWCEDEMREGQFYIQRIGFSPDNGIVVFYFSDPRTAFEFKMRWA